MPSKRMAPAVESSPSVLETALSTPVKAEATRTPVVEEQLALVPSNSAPSLLSNVADEVPLLPQKSLSRKGSLLSRMNLVKRFSSSTRRRSSDDSTASASSVQQEMSSSALKNVRVPATIPEQRELTKEQLDLALRNEQIEQAATERDAKRKRRVSDALSSMQRRFDAAFNAITAEMDEALQQSQWTVRERNVALAIVLALLLMPIFQIFWPAMFICIGLLVYSYKTYEFRQSEARQATDNVGARLDDLEDGIRRCILAVQHDLEADAEWEASMKEEQRMWEERQRELQVKRGKTLQMLNSRLNTRRKRLVEQIRNQAAHLPDHLPDVTQKARSLLEKKHFGYRPNRSRSASHSRMADSDGANGEGSLEPDTGASPAWIKYVNANLPLERLVNETEEEKQFGQVLHQKTEGKWDLVPRDLQMMVLRGYADKKDRLKESVEAIKYIVEWREHSKSDDLLKTADEDARLFFYAWATRFGGEDRYGHHVVYDRVENLDLKYLLTLDDDPLLRMRTKQMEVLRRMKLESSQRRGHRVCKHVYIFDLQGLSISKHFTPRVKNLLQHIFKVGGDAYPDSLWTLWLINTPMVFQVVWKVIGSTIDPVTKAKIRMVGGKDKYIPEMEKCGIPKACIPKELGGDCPSTNLFETLKEFMEDDRLNMGHAGGGGGIGGVVGDRMSAGTEGGEPPSAIDVVPDESGL